MEFVYIFSMLAVYLIVFSLIYSISKIKSAEIEIKHLKNKIDSLEKKITMDKDDNKDNNLEYLKS